MKKKIIIVQETLDGGGAEKVLVDILNNFDYDKYDIDLLLIKNQGVYLDHINKRVKVKYISSKSKNQIIEKIKNKLLKDLYINKFSNYIHRKYIGNKYDIEISFLEGPSTKIIANSCNKKSNKIAWVHTDLRRLRRLSFKEEKSLYSKYNSIICVSNEVKDALIELYPENKEKCNVIYNLIDTKNVIKKSKLSVDYPFEGNNIVTVGRLIKSKRFDLIIRAHSEVIKSGINHNLIILGEGTLKDDLVDLSKQLNVQDTVKFLGFIENPYPYIKNSDIYVMASDYEGLPLVICEALTLGKMIVSTKCTGPNELLGYGKYGMLVECNNYIELSEKIKDGLVDKKLRKYYEDKTIEQMSLFKEENIMKQIYKIIDKEKGQTVI